MSKRYYARHNKQVVILADTPFSGGGEGQLYHVTLPKKQHWVAKIYHPSKRTVERANKMAYLQQHPPHTQEEQGAWVVDILEDKRGNFLGVLMPFQRGEKLEVLCGINLPRFLNNTWQDWGLKSPKALEARFHLGLQLAAVVAQLHDSQHYILVDLKPDNILVEVNGHLSLVDLDSVAVVEQGNLRFAAPMATPEYAPPEYHQEHPAFLPSWDNFSLAVILYKLFCGIHPYAATAHAPYEHSNSLGQKIREGLFVHSTSKAAFFQVIPPPHKRFKALPSSLQELFIQCFEVGHEHPEKRPTASTWCWALLDIVGDTAMIHEFRELLVDGWDRPRQPLLLPSRLLLEQQQQTTWEGNTPKKSSLSSLAYERGCALLEELENSEQDSRTIQVLFLLVAVFCLVVLCSLVVVYTTVVQAILVFSIAYIIKTIVSFYNYGKRKNALKKTLYYHKEKQTAATNKWQELKQAWEVWKTQELLQVKASLEEVTTNVKAKDDLVRQLLKERSKAYEEVVQQYKIQLRSLNLPQEWLRRSWTTIIQLLEWQAIDQEDALALAVQESSLQQIHEKALQQKEEALQQAEEQLLEEARVLFDWTAFFDPIETGLSWGKQTLLTIFQEQKIPNLLAIEQLTWTVKGDLEVQFGQQKLLLEKAVHQQLEVFYEVYQWHQPSLEFARNQASFTALDYLRARFLMLQQTHQQEVVALKLIHKAEQDAAYLPHQQALEATKEQLKQVETLKKARKIALLQVEEDYQQLYIPIAEAVEEEVLQVHSKLLEVLKRSSEAHWEQLEQERTLIELEEEVAIENQKIKQLL